MVFSFKSFRSLGIYTCLGGIYTNQQVNKLVNTPLFLVIFKNNRES